MQLSLPWAAEMPAARQRPVLFVRHRRARRYILRVLADGTVRVTLPRWGVKRDAQAFLDASRAWIERQQRARSLVTAPPALGPGATVLVDGVSQVLRIERSAGKPTIWCGDERIAAVDRADADLRPIVDQWLFARARRELPEQLLACAAAHGISVGRVSIRNQQSRWGACSPAGTITLNWRLVQTPPHVREYVLLHELMHRRELNHSRRFWRLVAACCPCHAEARRWLRQEGKALWVCGS